MLKSIKRSREQKNIQRAEELLRKGALQLEGKLYKQAMIAFQQAHEMEPNLVEKKLQKEFDASYGVSDFEAALSIGLVLIKMKREDYELANILGNCARRQHNYKQANNLYRHALKINKNYVPAFYNLAASMGKVDKYDLDVKESLRIFDKISDYILPDYEGNPDIENEISEQLIQQNEERKEKRITELEQEIGEKENEGEILDAKKLKYELKQLTKSSTAPTHEQICDTFRARIKDKESHIDDETDRAEYLAEIHNLGLYALNNKDPETALECFQNLKSLKATYKYLNMYIAIAKTFNGETKEALEIFIDGLGDEQHNRFFNVNLGLMYRKNRNMLLSTKYLAIGAELLEKSDGLYHLSDLIRIADQCLEEGQLKKALKLYKIVVAETSDVNIWSNIGEIYIHLENYKEAVNAYREILKIDPESKHADLQLMEIHDIYQIKGDAFFRDSKFKAAASMFERALRVKRIPETVKQTIAVYKLLKDFVKVEELTLEYEEMQKREKEKENEKVRQEYIRNGKISLKRRDYKQAIESFELAFRMKLDKDVFVFLATIYKAMKRTEEMQGLLQRWNKMVEHEEKMKKFEKQEQRESKSE